MACIGIRREDKDRWEARTPLTPPDVADLIDTAGVRVMVQPSGLRIFHDDEYARVGATLHENLSACDIVLAVKEIPDRLFEPGKTYVFFSHTIKGQPRNMAMLRRLMELRCQLIDYERVRDEHGRRLIYFSRFAGLAGAIDTLWALGRRLDAEGLRPNPFAAVEQTYRYGSLDIAFAALAEAGRRIADTGLPPELCPFVIGVSGYGKVAQGAQEVLHALGARTVSPSDLEALSTVDTGTNAVYSVGFSEVEMVQPRDPGKLFDLTEYYEHPELYEGRFERWLQHLTVLMNCIYWDERYPRLATKAAVRDLFDGGRPRLRVIGDISCDIEGSIEFTLQATSIDDPVYVYDPFTESTTDGVDGRGVVVMAIDNLPCELPLEASEAFSTALTPFMPALASADFDVPFANLALPSELKRAVILHRGALTPEHAYMAAYL